MPHCVRAHFKHLGLATDTGTLLFALCMHSQELWEIIFNPMCLWLCAFVPPVCARAFLNVSQV